KFKSCMGWTIRFAELNNIPQKVQEHINWEKQFYTIIKVEFEDKTKLYEHIKNGVIITPELVEEINRPPPTGIDAFVQ
ncbi:unnamed protein product, partial [marine sediment metagenome]